MEMNRKIANNRDAFMASDVARLATELQRLGSTRTEALQEAERLQAKYGPGLTLGRLVEGQGEALHKIMWTPSYHGVSHTNTINDRWCTVNEYLTFATLRTITRDRAFSSPTYTFKTAEAARAAGETWLLSNGAVIPKP